MGRLEELYSTLCTHYCHDWMMILVYRRDASDCEDSWCFDLFDILNICRGCCLTLTIFRAPLTVLFVAAHGKY